MFGLMKGTGCTSTETQKDDYRLHYCGTCKTIGNTYGQSARLLLNFDVVFLAELLSSLNAENPAKWSKAYQSYNCFQLPDSNEEIPFPLQYAAAVNVLLAELKMDDNQRDGAAWLWKSARRLFSGPFGKATRKLKDLGLERDQLLEWVDLQSAREASVSNRKSGLMGEQIADHLSEPTGLMTGYVFERGAALMTNSKSSSAMYDLGKSFGEMMYLVDAWEDFDKDFRKGEFNAIRVAYPGRELSSDDELKESLLSKIHLCEQKVTRYLKALPISGDKKQLFTSRLALNLSSRLYPRPHTCQTTTNQPTSGISAASIPQLFRKAGDGIRHSLAYASPMNLKKFSLTYAAFTAMLFVSELSAASRMKGTVQEVDTFTHLGGWAVGGFVVFAGMGYLAKRSLEIYQEENAKKRDLDEEVFLREKKNESTLKTMALTVGSVLATIPAVSQSGRNTCSDCISDCNDCHDCCKCCCNYYGCG